MTRLLPAPVDAETARRAGIEAAVAGAHGAEAVAPGVVRFALATPTLPPATTTNHVLLGPRAAIVVDPASPHADGRSRLLQLCRALERDAGWSFATALPTHHHRDHFAAAAPLRFALGVDVVGHRRTAALLGEQLSFDRHVDEGDWVGGAGGTGDEDRGWQVWWTPGHAPGHLALVHHDGAAIVGDLVAGEGTILIDPSDGDMGLYLSSLARLVERDPPWLIPAHGPVLRPGRDVLQRTINHRKAREAKILAALSWNLQAEDALLPTAYDDTPRRIWPLALRSLRSHLWHLHTQGLAQSESGRWRKATLM